MISSFLHTIPEHKCRPNTTDVAADLNRNIWNFLEREQTILVVVFFTLIRTPSSPLWQIFSKFPLTFSFTCRGSLWNAPTIAVSKLRNVRFTFYHRQSAANKRERKIGGNFRKPSKNEKNGIVISMKNVLLNSQTLISENVGCSLVYCNYEPSYGFTFLETRFFNPFCA